MELANIADDRMYEAKSAYYRTKGIDRRGLAAAHIALCSLCTKILKINLTEDTYQIVNMNPEERSAEMGFSDSISTWLREFGKSGQVHEEDLEEYLKQTDIHYLSECFKQDKTSVGFVYRRKFGDVYKRTLMELIPADDYSDENQSLFLYVKALDR